MNLNCRCVLKYYVLLYSGLCWVLNKICRFKCGNNTKSETAFKKKTAYQASVHTKTEAKSVLLASGATKTEAKRISNFKKKSTYGLGCSENQGHKGTEFIKIKAHMASGGTKTKAKRGGFMTSGAFEPRQKRVLWLRFLTEAKSYPLLASPQYASVRELVQNIKNNRCQSPFLHWCLL